MVVTQGPVALRLTACVLLQPATCVWLVPVTGVEPVTGTCLQLVAMPPLKLRTIGPCTIGVNVISLEERISMYVVASVELQLGE